MTSCMLPQELTSRYLEQLSSGTTLTLAAFRPASKSGAAEIERITKVRSVLSLTSVVYLDVKRIHTIITCDSVHLAEIWSVASSRAKNVSEYKQKEGWDLYPAPDSMYAQSNQCTRHAVCTASACIWSRSTFLSGVIVLCPHTQADRLLGYCFTVLTLCLFPP